MLPVKIGAGSEQLALRGRMTNFYEFLIGMNETAVSCFVVWVMCGVSSIRVSKSSGGEIFGHLPPNVNFPFHSTE